jgi:5-methyltetrahydropteroyltriglutamate--homocysteine methyltransferase
MQNRRSQMFRSDIIGSLLRPAYLKEARKQREEGTLTPAEFKKVEDRAVNEAVDRQVDAGLPVVTDGEMRRYAFYGHFIDAVEGFDKYGGWAIPFRDEQGNELVLKRPVVVSKLKRIRPMTTEEYSYARARTELPVKVTLINAQQAAAYYDAEKSKGAYPNLDAYLADVVDILRLEVEELIHLGCTYIQLDAPQYAGLLDPGIREGYRKRGMDPERLLDRTIEMDNAVIGDHPGITFGVHLCRGNNQSKFYASGGYDPIVSVFERTRFQRFLLEYDDERSGGFEPLAHVPGDREVVLGLVTTKKPALEDRDMLKRRIEEATRYIPLERLGLSPQCGFASTEAGNLLSESDQDAKLRLVVEVAREVWGA